MNTTITLPDGKRIVITPNADKRIVKMVNDVLHAMDSKG
jgi:uncharacterized protein YlzI (FlbEa/FlbD family)